MTDTDRAFDGVIVDIEGTTTPISFVDDTLFPYARARLHDFLSAHANDVGGAIHLLRDEWQSDWARGEPVPALANNANGDAASWVPYLEWLMDRDRKSTGLKLIQGRIWDAGFSNGALCGEVYADVAPALAKWKAAGAQVAIYSSGSVLAQQQLFAHSTAGDLSGFIDSYFDTGVGAKRDSASYRRIATVMGLAAERVVFISDVSAELDAARQSGMSTRLCQRAAAADAAPAEHPTISDFDSVAL